MILAFAAKLGLLAQVATLATAPAPKAAPIRVWIADSTVFVKLRDPGYLTVLHVDPVGRIRVLFPLNPDDNAAAPGGATFELAAPVGAEGGTGTIVAARARAPLQVAGLRAGPFWDYENGMLFQPTAGNALAALLDIADRMADGRRFDFDVTTYRTGGPVAARDPQLTTPVCLGCVRSHTAPQSTVVINQSNIVDCSGAGLVNSFCGVVDNRVTNTYVYNEVAPAAEPIYVPYYVPVFIPRRRRPSPPPPPPPQRTLAIAFPLRRASAAVVPPPPGRRPAIDVQQPRQRYAPIEPRQREALDNGSAPPAAAPPSWTTSISVQAAPAVPRYVGQVGAGMPVRAPASWELPATRAAEPTARLLERQPGTMSVPMTQSRVFVPSSSLLRTIRTRPH
jgi:hypothetical protein